MKKSSLKRNIQLIVRVTPEEKSLIFKKKMPLAQTNNFNAYARKMLLDGKIINVDLSNYHELASEVNKIGMDINQIVHKANKYSKISAEKIDELQEMMNTIWQLLKLSLSEVQSKSR